MSDGATRQGVRETFDRIAEHFARTRADPWDEVTAFLEGREAVGIGLDLGCANGRHLPVLSTVCDRVVGIDVSRALLEVARQDDRTDASLIQGDATALPLQDDGIGVALYVATLHHLPSERERRASLGELARVLRPHAPVLISTWSVAHERFDNVQPGDHFVPWTLPSGERLDRYYHLYDLDSFRSTVEESRLGVDRIWEENGNCWAICRGTE